MAKRARAKQQSKMSRGTRRQRELLETSRCKPHKALAVTTLLLPEGKYVHKCGACLKNPTGSVTRGEVLEMPAVEVMRLLRSL